MKLELFDALLDDFKFGVTIRGVSMHDYGDVDASMRVWCTEQFGKRNYTASFNIFYFNAEEQRNWFILRWS
jgi:hypothetical protein